jgi:anthranilate phosphoribosyltransferase
VEIENFISKMHAGADLSVQESVDCFDALQSETEETKIASLLTAWSKKGATVDEIFALARELRSRCKKVKTKHQIFIDAVGTGGSRSKSFNVSTAAAFVIAGAGIPVAKHGNRAATSLSGSADVLFELGVRLESATELAEDCLDEIGICFMFAPHFHSLSPILGKVRRELGFPTIFNTLGPLCNPASAPIQLIGASDSDVLKRMAEALFRLGTTRSWIVHGLEGVDEVSTAGPTLVADVTCDGVAYVEISPEDFGITRHSVNGMRPMSPAESAELITRILNRDASVEPATELVLVNAAAAIRLCSPDLNYAESVEAGKESVQSGSAFRKLHELRERTNQ